MPNQVCHLWSLIKCVWVLDCWSDKKNNIWRLHLRLPGICSAFKRVIEKINCKNKLSYQREGCISSVTYRDESYFAGVKYTLRNLIYDNLTLTDIKSQFQHYTNKLDAGKLHGKMVHKTSNGVLDSGVRRQRRALMLDSGPQLQSDIR